MPGLAIHEIVVGVPWGGYLWLFETWCKGPPPGLHARPECLVAAQFLAMTQKGPEWPGVEWQDSGHPSDAAVRRLAMSLAGWTRTHGSSGRQRQPGESVPKKFDPFQRPCKPIRHHCRLLFKHLEREYCGRDDNGMPL